VVAGMESTVAAWATVVAAEVAAAGEKVVPA